MLDRRRFLGSALAGAAVAALPSSLLGQTAPMPARELYDEDEEAYWTALRRLFPIPDDVVYLNNGTVGSCPEPVVQAVFDGYRETEKAMPEDPEAYPIWGYGPWNEFREPLARFVGCSVDELALTRNCTEGNSYIANGVDMKPGDEVLMTDQEHPGGEQPWNLRAKRYGIVVKKLVLPKPPQNAGEIMEAVERGLTPRTRVVFVSHVSTSTGLVLPVKEICALARSKGILSAIDGAHVVGMMPLNIAELGCDFYTSSPHKWLMAPKGTGFLFVRDEVIDRVWNMLVTEGWDDPELRAQRFQQFGSSNVPSLWGLRAVIRFADEIGQEWITRRHRTLCDYLHS
jgi:selenocysteine lyase/cysteine desulfurase